MFEPHPKITPTNKKGNEKELWGGRGRKANPQSSTSRTPERWGGKNMSAREKHPHLKSGLSPGTPPKTI
ncbi:hypothetical protein AKJ57_02355 [candidate division MSBL1 archaeon SCGC-AAA259A05]|uniref:Uncharacterized protein n=1 Tax=candidate division MSBL1 archaeon SCGC-AAA259A05 TaxID=1698259 RepID=A0A133UAC3_9EURY|nr:hypothetical protein AKJ57_02355 [candidate division MSBL1 archaeon SCGC-AAA259A05]